MENIFGHAEKPLYKYYALLIYIFHYYSNVYVGDIDAGTFFLCIHAAQTLNIRNINMLTCYFYIFPAA